MAGCARAATVGRAHGSIGLVVLELWPLGAPVSRWAPCWALVTGWGRAVAGGRAHGSTWAAVLELCPLGALFGVSGLFGTLVGLLVGLIGGWPTPPWAGPVSRRGFPRVRRAPTPPDTSAIPSSAPTVWHHSCNFPRQGPSPTAAARRGTYGRRGPRVRQRAP